MVGCARLPAVCRFLALALALGRTSRGGHRTPIVYFSDNPVYRPQSGSSATSGFPRSDQYTLRSCPMTKWPEYRELISFWSTSAEEWNSPVVSTTGCEPEGATLGQEGIQA